MFDWLVPSGLYYGNPEVLDWWFRTRGQTIRQRRIDRQVAKFALQLETWDGKLPYPPHKVPIEGQASKQRMPHEKRQRAAATAIVAGMMVALASPTVPTDIKVVHSVIQEAESAWQAYVLAPLEQAFAPPIHAENNLSSTENYVQGEV